MSFDDWILALHVLSAFAFVAGLVLFWVLIVAVRRTDTPDGTIRMEPIVKVGNAAVGVGAGGTIVFGIWLAFSYGGYDIWDAMDHRGDRAVGRRRRLGQRTGVEYIAGMTKAEELEAAGQSGPSADLLALNRTHNGLVLHAAATVLILVILIVMIWKPGDMSLLATIRPDDENFPVFVHVLGAMILVGGLLTGASPLAFARAKARLLRLGYFTLLFVALPGYISCGSARSGSTRSPGGTTFPKKSTSPRGSSSASSSPTPGALLTLIALILGGIGVRRLRDGKGAGLLKATMVLALLVLAAALIAVWAMAGKPD